MYIDRSKYNIVEVVRCLTTDELTLGKLYVNDAFHCFTLEPPLRKFRSSKPYAVPVGVYDLALNVVSPKYRFRSPYNKYKGCVPRLLNVPNFEGILIHIGNFPKDTKGCILVGYSHNRGRLFLSTKAYLDLWTLLVSFKYPIKIIISDVKS